MAFATVVHEIAFATNPGSASPTWVDVSAYVIAADLQSSKRQRETSAVEAGHGSLVLTNTDGRFDDANTSSPYAPNVVPMRRYRCRATFNAITYDLFSGYVEDWQPAFEYPGNATITVPLVDAFLPLNAADYGVSAYEQELAADNPSALWRMDDPSATSTMTAAIGAFDGNYEGSYTLGEASIVAGVTSSAVRFTASSSDKGAHRGQGPITAVPYTVTAVIQVPYVDGELRYVFQCHAPTGVSFDVYLSNNTVLLGQPSGRLGARFPGGKIVFGNSPVADGNVHHVAVVVDGAGAATLYVDGVAGTNVATAGGAVTVPTFDAVSIGNEFAPVGYTDAAINGVMQMVAVFPSALSGARLLAHAQAATTAYAGDLSGARIGRLLDLAGWSATDRQLDAGQSTLQAASLAGSTALSEIQNVVATDGGVLIVTPTGKVRFFDRHSPLKSPYTTSQATFSDQAGGVNYDDVDSDLAVDLIRNVAVTARAGGVTQTVTDTTSVAKFFRRVFRKTDYQFLSDNEARDRAQYVVNRYKNPQRRFGKLTLTPYGSESTLFPQMLGRAWGDRITVTQQPPGQSVRTQDMHIDGISHRIGPGVAWSTEFQLTPVDPSAYYIVGTSTLGGAAVLGF